MMIWDRKKKILTMDLHNLLHCDFNPELLEAELFLSGIDDPGAITPRMIIVDGEGLRDLKNARDAREGRQVE